VGLILFIITSVFFFLAFSMYWPKVLSEGVGFPFAVTVFQGLLMASSIIKKLTAPSSFSTLLMGALRCGHFDQEHPGFPHEKHGRWLIGTMGFGQSLTA
jgi:hypothetical protein